MNLDATRYFRWGHKSKWALLALAGVLVFWFTDVFMDYYLHSAGATFADAMVHDAPALFICFIVTFFFVGSCLIIAKKTHRAKTLESQYGHVFANANDAIILVGIKGDGEPTLIEANPSAMRMLGSETEDPPSLSLKNILGPDEISDSISLPADRNGRESVFFEKAFKNSHGKEIIAQINAVCFDLNGKKTCLSIMRDVTEHKQNIDRIVQSEEQLRSLTARLMRVQETERARISSMLHDELGQALVFLKFRMSSIGGRLEGHGQFHHAASECESMISSLDQIIEYVRSLSRDLSPSVIKELGLTRGIRYLLEQFGENQGIECGVSEFDDVDDLFPAETRTDIVRVIQECLTNTARHSGASRLSLSVKKNCDHVTFSMEDNGKGFNSNGNGSRGMINGVGIPSMRERIRVAGGEFEIRSGVNKGVHVSFTVPFARKAQ